MSEPFKSFQVRVPGAPNPKLSTNRTREKHWFVRHELAQAARWEGKAEALAQLGPEPPAVKGAPISLHICVYHKPVKQHEKPDLESVLSSCKHYIDGIFDYLSGGERDKADDAQVETISITRCETKGEPQTMYYFMDLRWPVGEGRPF